jgi:hypothetical protein
MPKRFEPIDDDDDPDELPDDADDFTEEELADYYDLIGDFPELDDMDDILDFGDADFYTG